MEKEYSQTSKSLLKIKNTKKIIRHYLPDRIFHWVMAVCILVLLFTGFLPIVGVKFSWVSPHWIAGIILTVAIIFHIIRAVFWQDFWSMVIGVKDIKGAWESTRWALKIAEKVPGKPGKYPLLNKLYHHMVSTMSVIVVSTGLLMMVKINTPWWERNPYFFEDWTWGVVYVLHDFASLFFVPLVMVHIYFGIRPEKIWMTRAMILGWITSKEYEDHYDHEKWKDI